MVDEDIFEDSPRADTPPPSRVKKLYRDIDQKYIGGVSSGLEHYLGIDALWIRLIFIFFALFTGFGFIAYILLWILVPEAATTSQKLDMRGEPVNISNIERKVKEGFDDVTERVKNVDYEKVGKQVKSSGRNFFDTLGDIIMFFFKVIGKFIGILLIIVGAATLIGLFIGLFTVGILDVIHIPGIDFYDMVNSTVAPVWLVSVLTFLAVGIPFFFLLYLGLKILVNNLNSIGNIAKFSLLGLWLLAVITLAVLGIQQASAHAYTGSARTQDVLFSGAVPDTLLIRMRSTDLYEYQEDVGINGMTVTHNSSGDRVLFSDEIYFDLKVSDDSLAHILVRKDADGSSFDDARKRAAKVDYTYTAEGKTVSLDNFLTTGIENKVRDQEVRVTLFLPAGTVVQFDTSAGGHLGGSTRYDEDLYRSEVPDYMWILQENGKIRCLDCPDEVFPDEMGEDGHIIINEDGVDIDLKDSGDTFRMKIDEKGVQIKANNNQ
jgi:phage shock protein PspC (stress-responsive transcriptional regulator)